MRKLITFLCFFSLTASAADFPMVVDPVVNATPPGSTVTAGYMSLINETDKDITITGVSSPTIAKIEIHLSSIKDDVASMEKQDSLIIKSGETLELKHGSYHLMLMELTQPLSENQSVDVIFDSSVGEFLIEMPVKRIGATTHKKSDTEKTEEINTDSPERQDVSKDGDAHKDKTKVIH